MTSISHRQSDARLRATSVLTSRFVEGDLDGALSVLDEMIAAYPERRHNHAYLRTMVLTLLGRTQEAVAEVRATVGAGGWWSRERLTEPEFEQLAAEPGYQDAVTAMAARSDQALAAAAAATASVREYAGVEPRAAVVALHMYGVTAEETAGIWAEAPGVASFVPESTYLNSDGAPGWDDPGLARRDVAVAVERARAAAPGLPLLLAGGSQGAATAMTLAAEGAFPEIRGVIAVVGACPPDAVVGPGSVPVFSIGGEADPMTLANQRAAHDALAAAGIAAELDEVADLPHIYPPDWAEWADRAVDFCLGS
ncbi:hypothetical protein [Nocardioides speluncae]|uniref:hypothetical protein n=1 Tax=Nocardioides speluncae TaxID=2670337 RepID=UPI0012B17482|nr:hypothetical protein [Nocardioides speluncae]